MTQDMLRGKWNQLKGEAQKQWGKLTNDEMDQIQGNKDKLIGKLQEKYGYSKEKATNEVDTWLQRHNFS